MLYITTRLSACSPDVEQEWHTDNPMPEVLTGRIINIQADGEELEWIQSFYFTHMCNGRVVSWHFEAAQSLYTAMVANLGTDIAKGIDQ